MTAAADDSYASGWAEGYRQAINDAQLAADRWPNAAVGSTIHVILLRRLQWLTKITGPVT